MANAIPYSPVPTVAPERGGTPYLRVPDSIAEASGQGLARAGEGLGRSLEGAADKLESNVLMLQNMENETWAKNADVDVMVKIGQAQSEFDQKEGQNATQALPGHMENIKQIRQEALDSAPNNMARKMLDQSIARRVGFAIVDSGHKAGTQAKVASRAAGKARVEAAQSQFDITNPETAKANLKTIESEVRSLGRDIGAAPETVDNITRKETSKAWLHGFLRAAPGNPQRAKDTFDEVKDDLDPDVRQQAEVIVNRAMTSHQTRIDADEILRKKNFDPSKGPGQLDAIQDEAKKYIERKGKDNPDYGDYLENRIRTKFNVGMEGYKDTQRGFEFTVGKFILGQDDKSRIVDIDGVAGPKAPAEVREAYQSLEPAAQRRVNNWIGRMARGESIGWTTDGLRRFSTLKGMAKDPESMEEFYNMGPEGILKENIPNAAKRELLSLQQNVKSRAMNVTMNKSMATVESMLNAAGISRTSNREAYLQFRDAFEDQITDFQGEHKKPVSPEEARKIASGLLQNMYKDQGFWTRMMHGNTPVFQAGVPSGVSDNIKDEFKTKGFPEPTEEQIQRAYAYKLYKKLYQEKQDAAPPTAPKSVKTVPVKKPAEAE